MRTKVSEKSMTLLDPLGNQTGLEDWYYCVPMESVNVTITIAKLYSIVS